MHAIYFGHPEEEVPFTKKIGVHKGCLVKFRFFGNSHFPCMLVFRRIEPAVLWASMLSWRMLFWNFQFENSSAVWWIFFPNCGAQSQVLSFTNLYTAPSKQNSAIHEHLNIVYSPNLPWPAVHFALWWCESTPLSGGIYTTNTSQNCPENNKIIIENSTWIGLDSVHFRTP